MNFSKEQRFSFFSTFLFMVGFIGLLLFFGFSAPNPPPQEEGILINFGDSETGLGDIEPMLNEEPVVEEVSTPPVAQTPEPEVVENLVEEVVTQNFDQTAVIEEKKRKDAEEKKKKEELEEKKKNEELERQRFAEIEKKRLEEEERIKKENQQKAIDARAKSAFSGKNPNGGMQGEGNTQGTGNMGDPNGDINSKNRTGGSTGGDGISFSLNGRNSRSLPKPEYISKSEGKVVVEVTVDQNGNVVKAVPGVKGTTTSDKLLYQAAEKAAIKAKFDVNQNAPPQQVGTITYIFRLQ